MMSPFCSTRAPPVHARSRLLFLGWGPWLEEHLLLAHRGPLVPVVEAQCSRCLGGGPRGVCPGKQRLTEGPGEAV